MGLTFMKLLHQYQVVNNDDVCKFKVYKNKAKFLNKLEFKILFSNNELIYIFLYVKGEKKKISWI